MLEFLNVLAKAFFAGWSVMFLNMPVPGNVHACAPVFINVSWNIDSVVVVMLENVTATRFIKPVQSLNVPANIYGEVILNIELKSPLIPNIYGFPEKSITVIERL